jgi:hypothetical protein
LSLPRDESARRFALLWSALLSRLDVNIEP